MSNNTLRSWELMYPDEYLYYHQGFDLQYVENLQNRVSDALINAGYRVALIKDPTAPKDYVAMKNYVSARRRDNVNQIVDQLINAGYRVQLIGDDVTELSPSILTPQSNWISTRPQQKDKN